MRTCSSIFHKITTHAGSSESTRLHENMFQHLQKKTTHAGSSESTWLQHSFALLLHLGRCVPLIRMQFYSNKTGCWIWYMTIVNAQGKHARGWFSFLTVLPDAPSKLFLLSQAQQLVDVLHRDVFHRRNTQFILDIPVSGLTNLEVVKGQS